jgi:hypothetical protein
MDPARRELYVEGHRDHLFLTWLLAGKMNSDSTVREIATVDLPDELPGGEKGRLIHFAEVLGDRQCQIQMFADSDWDRILDRKVPARMWLTDYRDMEGYILREECFDKVLHLGIGTDQISGRDLLESVRALGRQLGLIRLMSELDLMRLPFRATSLKKYIKIKNALSLDEDGYLRALLQNANINLTRLAATKARLAEVEAAYASIPNSEIVHGKDATCIVEAVLSRFGLRAKEGTRLLWTSFEFGFVENGSALDVVARFLRGD